MRGVGDRAGAGGRTLLRVIILAATLSACTIVKVHDEQGLKVSYYPGLAVIKVTAADRVQVVEAESVGAAAVGNQFSLGWSHSRIALVPPGRCHFITWRLTPGQLAGLRGLLGPSTEICSSGGEMR